MTGAASGAGTVYPSRVRQL